MTPAAASGSFTSEQMTIARTAAAVADQRHLPAQAKVVILSTGFQESGIRNLTGGDRDSVGWLQQRPSAGWGTVAQIENPAYAAGKFFDALVRVPNWQTLPVTVAAQKVQISAYPDAYAKWVPKAVALLGQLGDTSSADTCTARPARPAAARCRRLRPSGQPAYRVAGDRRCPPDRAGGMPGYSVPGHCEGYITRPTATLADTRPRSLTGRPPAPACGQPTVPPRGALVFWRTGNPAGHVALSSG